MRRSNVFLIAVLVVLILMFAFTRTLRGQNTSRNLQLNQSRMNSYQADKKSYNNNPYAKPDDGYNKWLDSQMERTQKDRNQMIDRGFQERNRSNSHKNK